MKEVKRDKEMEEARERREEKERERCREGGTREKEHEHA